MSAARRKCIFNADLQKKYPYIRKITNKSESDVRCNLCHADFNIGNAGKTDIEKHLLTRKHTKSLQAASSSHQITNFLPSIDYGIAACEGVWAYHVIKANHSFKSSDCASKLFRTCFQVKNFHCARTKCEAIATNVFAPYAQNILKTELLQSSFICISTDASNHGNIKMLPIVVRFFIPTVGVRVKMLEFVSEKGESSEIIATSIMETAESNQINEKVVGFCADNCPTNFGSCNRGGDNNVLYRLNQWNPSLIGVGCAAHVVHNALKHACDCLPIDIECLVVKIYSHFYIYTVRVEALKEICEQTDVEYSKLLGYAKTRFLALGPAIRSILNLFEPLKTYFSTLRRCPTIIKSFFESPFAKLWLLFVKEQVTIDIKT